jgi:hypothetical protein
MVGILLPERWFSKDAQSSLSRLCRPALKSAKTFLEEVKGQGSHR